MATIDLLTTPQAFWPCSCLSTCRFPSLSDLQVLAHLVHTYIPKRRRLSWRPAWAPQGDKMKRQWRLEKKGPCSRSLWAPFLMSYQSLICVGALHNHPYLLSPALYSTFFPLHSTYDHWTYIIIYFLIWVNNKEIVYSNLLPLCLLEGNPPLECHKIICPQLRLYKQG